MKAYAIADASGRCVRFRHREPQRVGIDRLHPATRQGQMNGVNSHAATQIEHGPELAEAFSTMPRDRFTRRLLQGFPREVKPIRERMLLPGPSPQQHGFQSGSGEFRRVPFAEFLERGKVPGLRGSERRRIREGPLARGR